MQSIQFSRRKAYAYVRASRVAVVCFLSLVAAAQQLPPQTEGCSLATPGRCAADLAKDQRGILTSPLRIHKKDFAWIVPLAAVTGTALAFDHKALEGVSTDPTRVNALRTASNFTGIYVPASAGVAAWLVGSIRHDDHLRETGSLAVTAMIDTELFTTFMKFGADRVRPQAKGLPGESGEFWPEGKHSFSADSFPSGHTANAFAVAHVIADEYPGWKVKLAVYSLAAATGFERVEGREHFPSDVLIGGAVGYLIGGYVFDHHSTRSKTRVDFAPMVGHGGVGLSLHFSRPQSE